MNKFLVITLICISGCYSTPELPNTIIINESDSPIYIDDKGVLITKTQLFDLMDGESIDKPCKSEVYFLPKRFYIEEGSKIKLKK